MTDASVSLIVQVAEYTKHLASKEIDMESLHKTVTLLQGYIRILKTKLTQDVPTGKWGTTYKVNPKANPINTQYGGSHPYAGPTGLVTRMVGDAAKSWQRDMWKEQ